MKIIEDIKKQLNNNPDILERKLSVSGKDVYLLFIKSTVDKTLFVHSVISPLLDYSGEVSLDILSQSVIKAVEIEKIEKSQFTKSLLRNKVLLFIDGDQQALAIDMELLPTRQPSEPPTSPTIQGPREGFTESIKTTIALMRKQLPSKHLVIKSFFVGELSHTQVSMFYMDNLADKKLVKK